MKNVRSTSGLVAWQRAPLPPPGSVADHEVLAVPGERDGVPDAGAAGRGVVEEHRIVERGAVGRIEAVDGRAGDAGAREAHDVTEDDGAVVARMVHLGRHARIARRHEPEVRGGCRVVERNLDDVHPAARDRLLGARIAAEDVAARPVRVDEQTVVLEVGDERLGVRAARRRDERDHVRSRRVDDVDDVDALLAGRDGQVAARRAAGRCGRVPRADDQVVWRGRLLRVSPLGRRLLLADRFAPRGTRRRDERGRPEPPSLVSPCSFGYLLVPNAVPLRGNVSSCVCGFRCGSFFAPATCLSVRSQMMSPRVMSDS